ncbi:MAG: hypothetical protein QOG31_1416 [Thermoplasmata archaeon]|jgi:hypothetical protein|nr:hypothetical protein [Thermoplasmata archaeon]
MQETTPEQKTLDRGAWLAGLNLPDKAKPTFFQPESTPQRVVLVDVKGYGPQGIPHTIANHDDNGNIVSSKAVTKYAVATFLEVGTARESVWEILSLPAAVSLRDVIVRSGPDWSGNVVLDIHSEGRGLKKTFHLTVVSVARPLTDSDSDLPVPGASQ